LLKAQLKSKITQLDPAWRGIEDILTGDFFGTLDYLPRNPYLRDFISLVASLNPDVRTPSLDGTDWDNAEILFWPRMFSDEENAEPDIVIVSDKWLLVIEVKLQSGLSDTQPWREYVIGCKIAQEHSIPVDSVYYLVLARTRLDITPTFKATEVEQLNKLSVITSYLKWHETVALIESWLRGALAEHKRMLTDLFKAMRKRRAIAFSDFTFANMAPVAIATGGIFCPPRFTDFLSQIPQTLQTDGSVFLHHSHGGFIANCPKVDTHDQPIFLGKSFGGFARSFPKVTQTFDSLFLASFFGAFLNAAPEVKLYSKSIFFSSNFTGFLKSASPCKNNSLVFLKGTNQ